MYSLRDRFLITTILGNNGFGYSALHKKDKCQIIGKFLKKPPKLKWIVQRNNFIKQRPAAHQKNQLVFFKSIIFSYLILLDNSFTNAFASLRSSFQAA